MAETKNKNKKIETNYMLGLKFEKEKITELREKEEYIINCCGNIYETMIRYNDDRGKWQAIIKYNGRVNSLSFFDRPRDALRNIDLWIAAHNGQKEAVKGKIGD